MDLRPWKLLAVLLCSFVAVVGCESPGSDVGADAPDTEIDYAQSVGMLACPPGAGICATGPAEAACLDLRHVWAGQGKTRTETVKEAAQSFVATRDGFPSLVGIELTRLGADVRDARVRVDLRRLGAGTTDVVPLDEKAPILMARGEVPLFLASATQASVVQVPLQAVGRPQPLMAGGRYALVIRIVSPTSSAEARLGCVAAGSVVPGLLQVRGDYVVAKTNKDPFAPLDGGTPQSDLAGKDAAFWLELAPVAAPSCLDGLSGVGETDVDCGGPCDVRCATGKRCQTGVDCASGFCTAGVCQASPCGNKKLDPGEIDVDCGGICGGGKCAAGKRCATDGECASGLLCVGATETRPGLCVANTCNNGVKDVTETGTDCGGSCVRCAADAACKKPTDCLSGTCGKNGLCVAPSCTDKRANGDETDSDCGGSCSAKCTVGKKCIAGTDCATGRCDAGTCKAPVCADKVASGDESDVDCGGSCSTKCAATKKCRADADCASGLCNAAGTCAPDACKNGTQDRAESGLDCGGPCKPCVAASACKSAKDCLSGVCTKSVCQAPSCADKVRNGAESGVDCGASCLSTTSRMAGLCAAGIACAANGDCASGLCGLDGRCVDTCSNGLRDGAESGIDCGAVCGRRCPIDAACQLDDDCTSGVCMEKPHPIPPGADAAPAVMVRVCAEASCLDGKRNGNEAGVDCGGSCAVGCFPGVTCAVSTDCQSGICDSKTRTCVVGKCSDGVLNNSESDVDCGADCGTKKCSAGKRCRDAADCASGLGCNAGICLASACSNGRQDSAETAVDCGGPCVPCPADMTCKVGKDCASGLCRDGRCIQAGYGDGQANGNESDIDCGCTGWRPGSGRMAAPALPGQCLREPLNPSSLYPFCRPGQKCGADADCESNVCRGNVCQPATCADGLQNGAETGVDCGGGLCPGCGGGHVCRSDSECATGNCFQGACVDATCADGRPNGGESDVDCGGPCALDGQRCAVGQRCAIDGDCASNATCRGRICVPRDDTATTLPTTDPACRGVVCDRAPSTCHEGRGVCKLGLCYYPQRPAGAACSDGDACTAGDVCDPTAHCVGRPASTCDYACDIAGVRVRAGLPDVRNACQLCDPRRARDAWSVQPEGTRCGEDVMGEWGTCTLTGGVCSGEGEQSRTVTLFRCENGTCVSSRSVETRRCMADAAGSIRTTDGFKCGPETVGDWGRCQAPACGQQGFRSRLVSGGMCRRGVCETVERTEIGDCIKGPLDDTSCEQGQGCLIDGRTFPAGAPHPTEKCLYCDPRINAGQWSIRAGCVTETNGCRIDGQVVPAGFVNPQGPCQVCDPRRARDMWSPLPGCGEGDGCFIGGQSFPAGMLNPASACQVCKPELGRTAWTDIPGCTDQTAEVCTIDGRRYPAGASHPSTRCLICMPPVLTEWTPVPCQEPPAFCLIDGRTIRAGERNPSRPCEVCDPMQWPDRWNQTDACADQTCGIDGQTWFPGQPNPQNRCQVCDPARARDVWTTIPGCLQEQCVIDGVMHPKGASRGPGSCDMCDPVRSTTGWSSAPGCACFGPDGGPVPEGGMHPLMPCQSCGRLASGGFGWIDIAGCGGVPTDACLIDGQTVPPGARNPAQTCEVCDPRQSRTDWSPTPECGGTTGPGCVIGGLPYPAGVRNPQNTCQVCEPLRARDAWTVAPECSGTATGCLLDGQSVPSGDRNPLNACQVCNPHLNPKGWAPVPDCQTQAPLACPPGFVPVAGGDFVAGSSDDPAASPEHRVSLSRFCISRFEVTDGQIATGRPDAMPGELPAARPWRDASAFCARIGGRLPTEAEWELSARGFDRRPFPWGFIPPTCSQAQSTLACGRPVGVDSVGRRPAGASPFGLEDMSGNREEWVQDRWLSGYYIELVNQGIVSNPFGPNTGSSYVVRGGGAQSINPVDLTAYHRRMGTDAELNGFRCVVNGFMPHQ